MIQPKLNVSVVSYKIALKCDYCFEEFPIGYRFKGIVTVNEAILSIFDKRPCSGSRRLIRLCQLCFSKLEETLEECESIGWQPLEIEEK